MPILEWVYFIKMLNIAVSNLTPIGGFFVFINSEEICMLSPGLGRSQEIHTWQEVIGDIERL